jgi:hypothetical protein
MNYYTSFPDFTGAKLALRQVSLDDFHAYMQEHKFIFVPARALWPKESVNIRLPRIEIVEAGGNKTTIKPAAWLGKHKPVEQLTWAPGEPILIRNRLLFEGGWITHGGVCVFNLYLPPTVTLGDPDKAGPWIDHVELVYPDNADHIIDFLAHRVQRPGEKINHALVLGGDQGIGKDTLLAPARQAVGPWNCQEASPKQVLGRFNGFLKSVILRINEARDLGEYDRFAFYDHMKAYTAAPPEVLRIDEKNIREYLIPNLCGVIITTNHKTDGIHLPADDRRNYVAWSDLDKDAACFQGNYWNDLWHWYREEGGFGHVAAYLAERDISNFDPYAPPPKTPAFWSIVDASRAPEVSELADAIDDLGNPNTLTLEELKRAAFGLDLWGWLDDRKNRRSIPHRLESCGYVPVHNDAAKDGLWKIGGKRQAIYARKELSLRDQIVLAKVRQGQP